MGKYFGTDGIRGKYEVDLTQQLVKKVAIAAACVFGEGSNICIGSDPRQSSPFIVETLIDGLINNGVNVTNLGVISTPVISKTIIDGDYVAGIMISASHNPYYDNGIKFFGANGMKLSDDLENAIEKEINNTIKKITTRIGVAKNSGELVDNYIDYLVSLGCDLNGAKIGLDCANGSAYEIAPKIFDRLNAQVFTIANEPNGVNINDGVGSTHPENLSRFVVENNLDYGFAFDGDADRIILVNKKGDILDGDYIIYLITKRMSQEGVLNNNLVVGTVMANLGFKAAIKELGVEFVETAVGDRYVMQAIASNNASVGGEQSGHIILPDLLPTGDGILTAVYLAKIFTLDIDQLDNLETELVKFPQTLVNIKVENKNEIMESEELNALIETLTNELDGSGRILVRASGTESLVRVMVEAVDLPTCNKLSDIIIDKINQI
jgi:phosphoglucosamine mutase